MALSPVNSSAFDQGNTANGSDVLAEVNNILNNALTLISPLTGNLDCNAKQLVSMIPETVASDPSSGTAGETYYQSVSKQLVVWNGTAAHTYVTRTAVETLTNKTLTQPRIGTNIRDTNGNELVVLTATASAVNELTLANAATGNNPSLTASGDDANISINLVPKGSGVLRVNGTTVATATNTLTMAGKTLSSPVINTSIAGTAIGGTPSTQAIGDSAAGGSSGVITRLDHKHGMPSFGTVASSICQGNDSRLSNARTPTAHVINHTTSGSDPFTSAYTIEAISKRLRETSGPTTLLLSTVTDGQFLKRSGSSIISGAAGGSVYTGSFTRDMTAAGGNVSYTGVGGVPKGIIFFGAIAVTNTGAWMGGTTSAGGGGIAQGLSGSNIWEHDTSEILLVASSGNYQFANIASMDADGFTLTWSKTGSPTGTGTVRYLAFL